MIQSLVATDVGAFRFVSFCIIHCFHISLANQVKGLSAVLCQQEQTSESGQLSSVQRLRMTFQKAQRSQRYQEQPQGLVLFEPMLIMIEGQTAKLVFIMNEEMYLYWWEKKKKQRKEVTLETPLVVFQQRFVLRIK